MDLEHCAVRCVSKGMYIGQNAYSRARGQITGLFFRAQKKGREPKPSPLKNNLDYFLI
jgi:hypothetical protein